VHLVLRGEVDLASTPILERELKRAEATASGRIVLDLGELEFIDSSGLSCLMRAQQRASANGHTLILKRIPAQAKRLFYLTGFDSGPAAD